MSDEKIQEERPPMRGSNYFQDVAEALHVMERGYWIRFRGNYTHSDPDKQKKIFEMGSLSEKTMKGRMESLINAQGVPEDVDYYCCIILDDLDLVGNGFTLYFKNDLLVGTTVRGGIHQKFVPIDGEYRFEKAMTAKPR